MRERTPFRESGIGGWLLLGGVVIVWDAYAPETMTSAWRRARRSKKGLAAVTAVWAVTTAHLYDQLPETYDPFIWAVKAARYRRMVRHV